MLQYANQIRPHDTEKHYTPLRLAQRLVSLVPIQSGDVVLDPASGRNKVFYHAFPFRRFAREMEIEEGSDFLEAAIEYDWAVTNPPYHVLWRFIEKTSVEARKGFGFLISLNGLNSLTPKRLEVLRSRRFHMRRLHVVNVKKWMGRYYFVIFSKRSGTVRHSWDTTTWI